MRTGITLCLYSTMQLFSAAQLATQTNNQTYMSLSDMGHLSTNASYQHAETHARKTQSSRNDTQTERNQPTQVAPKICIIMATILSLTIVLTLWRIWRNKNLLQTTTHQQTQHLILRQYHIHETYRA